MDIEEIAHQLYLADLDYDGSGDKYRHLAKAVARLYDKKTEPRKEIAPAE
jgi:hypothetical protein